VKILKRKKISIKIKIKHKKPKINLITCPHHPLFAFFLVGLNWHICHPN